MNNKFILASVSMLVLNTVQAEIPKPDHCPSVSAIQANGLHDIFQEEPDAWLVGAKYVHFDTNEVWSFVLGLITAQDKEEALQKANIAATTLNFQAGPFRFYESWACSYVTEAGYDAFAITPGIGLNFKIANWKR